MFAGSIIGASLLKFIIGPFWGKASEWADSWIDKRTKVDTARAEAELAKAQAEASMQIKKIEAEIEWETRALDGMEKSWKDEFILILWSLPLVGLFIPFLQGYFMLGFKALEAVPDWYFQGWGVIIATVYGAKRFFDGMDRWLTSRHERKVMEIEAQTPLPEPPADPEKRKGRVLPHKEVAP